MNAPTCYFGQTYFNPTYFQVCVPGNVEQVAINDFIRKNTTKAQTNVIRVTDRKTGTTTKAVAAIVRVNDLAAKTVKKALSEILRIFEQKIPKNRIRFIQSVTGSGSGTSMTLTFGSPPTKGNGVILTIGIDSTLLQTVSSITQAGAVWQQAIGKTNLALDSEIWYADNLQEAPGSTITINFSGVTLEAHATAREYQGLEELNVLDRTATNNGSSSNTDTGTTLTTTVANELWVGSTSTLSLTNQSAPTNSFIQIDGAAGTLMSNAYLERFQTVTGQADSGTTSGNATWAGCVATFKSPSVYEVFISEIFRIYESVSKRTGKVLNDILRVAATAAKTTTKRLFDILRIRDSTVRTASHVFTDSLRIRDFTTRTTSKVLSVGLSIVDRISTHYTYARSFNDALRVNDYLRKNITKVFTAVLRIQDYIANLPITIAITDALRITDTALVSLIHGIRRLLVRGAKSVAAFLERNQNPNEKTAGSQGAS